MLDAALAAKPEADPAALDVGVAVAQRRQAERAVGAGVFVVADPDQGGVEQPDERRQHRLAPRRGSDRRRQVGLDALPDPRQRRAELEHALELAGIARQPPVGVVAVLLAAARVAPGRLQVAVRSRADPDLLVGRRDRQGADPPQLGGVADQPAVEAAIAKAVADALAPDPGLVVADPDQPGRRLGRRSTAVARRAPPAARSRGGDDRRRRPRRLLHRAGRAGRTRVVDRRRHALGVLRRGRQSAGAGGAGGSGAGSSGARAARDRSSMGPALIPAKVAASDAPGRPIAPRPRALRRRCSRGEPGAARPFATMARRLRYRSHRHPCAGKRRARIATNRTETLAMNFPALRTTQKQQHTVTPRLQHAVRLLQLSSLDFAQEVHDAMGRNPFLEVEEPAHDDAPAAAAGDGVAVDLKTGDADGLLAPVGDSPYERDSWQQSSVERAHPGRGERPQRPRPDRRRRRPSPAPAHPDQRPAARRRATMPSPARSSNRSTTTATCARRWRRSPPPRACRPRSMPTRC